MLGYLVIEEADFEDILHTGNTVGHVQVTEGVAHQNDVAVVLQLLEVLSVSEGPIVFIVYMNELSFEALDDSLSHTHTDMRTHKNEQAEIKLFSKEPTL